MKGFQCGKGGQHDLGGFLRWQRPALNTPRKRFSVNELHDQNQTILLLGNVVDPARVWVRDLRSGARFLPKAAAGRGRIEFADDLLCDDALQARVLRFVHDTHPTFPHL
jgi:hypothetical protein